MSDGDSDAARAMKEWAEEDALKKSKHIVKEIRDVTDYGVSFYGETNTYPNGMHEGGATIRTVIQQLVDMAGKVGYNAILRVESTGYDGPSDITVELERQETNDEQIVREKEEVRASRAKADKEDKAKVIKANAAEKLKAKELKEYERLKEKYAFPSIDPKTPCRGCGVLVNVGFDSPYCGVCFAKGGPNAVD